MNDANFVQLFFMSLHKFGTVFTYDYVLLVEKYCEYYRKVRH